MYLQVLKEKIECVEITNVFDSAGQPVVVRVGINIASKGRAALAVTCPKSVKLRRVPSDGSGNSEGQRKP